MSASAHGGYGPKKVKAESHAGSPTWSCAGSPTRSCCGGRKLQEASGLWMATRTAAAVLAKLARVNERSHVCCAGQSQGGKAVCTL